MPYSTLENLISFHVIMKLIDCPPNVLLLSVQVYNF